MTPDTSAFGSCSTKLNGEFFVFGGKGSSQIKQVIFLKSQNYQLKEFKVERVFQSVVVFLLLHAESGPNDHREDAFHFILDQ